MGAQDFWGVPSLWHVNSKVFQELELNWTAILPVIFLVFCIQNHPKVLVSTTFSFSTLPWMIKIHHSATVENAIEATHDVSSAFQLSDSHFGKPPGQWLGKWTTQYGKPKKTPRKPIILWRFLGRPRDCRDFGWSFSPTERHGMSDLSPASCDAEDYTEFLAATLDKRVAWLVGSYGWSLEILPVYIILYNCI